MRLGVFFAKNLQNQPGAKVLNIHYNENKNCAPKNVFCHLKLQNLATVTPTLTLTFWEPGYDIFVPRFWPKTSSCQLPYQRPSSSTNCARELFKGLNGSNSLLVCTRKNFFGWGLWIFC